MISQVGMQQHHMSAFEESALKSLCFVWCTKLAQSVPLHVVQSMERPVLTRLQCVNFGVQPDRRRGPSLGPPPSSRSCLGSRGLVSNAKVVQFNTNTRLYSNGLVSLKRDYADLHPIVPSRSGSRTHAAN